MSPRENKCKLLSEHFAPMIFIGGHSIFAIRALILVHWARSSSPQNLAYKRFFSGEPQMEVARHKRTDTHTHTQNLHSLEKLALS